MRPSLLYLRRLGFLRELGGELEALAGVEAEAEAEIVLLGPGTRVLRRKSSGLTMGPWRWASVSNRVRYLIWHENWCWNRDARVRSRGRGQALVPHR